MRSAANWLCVAGILGLCRLAAGPGVASAQDVPAPTQNAMAGSAVFGEKGCVRCHSVSGEGRALGPDFRAASGKRSFEDLSAALWDHLPEMSRRMDELGIERPRLSAREAGDLFAFLYTLGFFGSTGDATRGEDLFATKGCIRCHRVRGVGGVVGPDLDHVGDRGVPIEIATAMWNHGPAMGEAARARGIPRPSLTGGELENIIAFLQSGSESIPPESIYLMPGDPKDGGEVMVEKGCAGCHGAPGGAGRMGPDLAGIARQAGLIDFVAAMWNKAPAMLAAFESRGVAFPRLEPSEVADLVAYLYSIDYVAGGGSVARGRSILRSKGCTACHGADRQASDLSTVSGVGHPAALTAALWNHVLTPESRPPSDEAWPSLDGRDIADLTAYFQASTP